MNAPTEEFAGYRPCLILAHTDAGYASQTMRAFRRQGWDVYAARNGPEARRLARMLQPQLVILDADLPEESGWLACNKLMRVHPGMRVVLVSAEPTPHLAAFASFVGAVALADQRGGLAALLPHLHDPGLPAVG